MKAFLNDPPRNNPSGSGRIYQYGTRGDDQELLRFLTSELTDVLLAGMSQSVSHKFNGQLNTAPSGFVSPGNSRDFGPIRGSHKRTAAATVLKGTVIISSLKIPSDKI